MKTLILTHKDFSTSSTYSTLFPPAPSDYQQFFLREYTESSGPAREESDYRKPSP